MTSPCTARASGVGKEGGLGVCCGGGGSVCVCVCVCCRESEQANVYLLLRFSHICRLCYAAAADNSPTTRQTIYCRY